MTENKLKKLWLMIEVNAVLWLIALGMVVEVPDSSVKVIVIAGLIVGAILHHWAYYGIYKPSKKK